MFVPLLIASFALNSPPSSPATQSVEPKSTISAVQAAILQGDGARARDLLASLPTDLPDAKDRDFRACSLARLDGPTSAVDGRTPAFTQRLLAIYHRYWRDSVMMPVDRDAAQDRFHNALADLLEMPRSTALDTITDRTKARIEEAGFHAITGKTGLLHDLIMWSKQADRLEVVPLPDGPIKTRVFYLDSFQSVGWANYLTCDRTGTGGWATQEGLYVVVPSYDLKSEDFRVSFLAHESQHFSDYARFPGLESWQLEYRAKLVELIYAGATRERILTRFANNQGNAPNEPHSYANRMLLASLRRRLVIPVSGNLTSVSPAVLKDAALAEFRADTASLSAKMVARPTK